MPRYHVASTTVVGYMRLYEGEREGQRREWDGGWENCCHSSLRIVHHACTSHLLVQDTDALHGSCYDNNMLRVK